MCGARHADTCLDIPLQTIDLKTAVGIGREGSLSAEAIEAPSQVGAVGVKVIVTSLAPERGWPSSSSSRPLQSPRARCAPRAESHS